MGPGSFFILCHISDLITLQVAAFLSNVECFNLPHIFFIDQAGGGQPGILFYHRWWHHQLHLIWLILYFLDTLQKSIFIKKNHGSTTYYQEPWFHTVNFPLNSIDIWTYAGNTRSSRAVSHSPCSCPILLNFRVGMGTGTTIKDGYSKLIFYFGSRPIFWSENSTQITLSQRSQQADWHMK